MGTTGDKLNKLLQTKSAIKNAIINKGVNVADTDTFASYANKIENISGGDSSQYTVIYNLSNVTSSNTATTVNGGNAYTTTLTANSGYELDIPTITVDGIDVTSKYYSDGIFTINNVFGNIVITATATELIIADGITLNYSFNNDIPGNGYGTISLLVDNEEDAGDYVIKYADSDGEMTNYDSICTLGVNAGTQSNYTYFNEHQLIPKYATKLIAVKDDEVKAEFVIPTAKRFTSGDYGEHLYSFGALSDIHVGQTTWDTDTQAAFTYLNEKENVVFTCASGDITNNGTAEEFANFKAVKDEYSADTPFYSTNGNHETYGPSWSDELWETYMESPRDYVFTQGNDVFIMLAIDTTDGSTCFTDDRKAWLETLLARYANCRVFVFCHYFINGTDNGNFNNYYGGNILTTTNAGGSWILGLLQQYNNVFYCSGHSHIKFIIQELCNKITVCNEYNSNEIGYLLHLPSITCPRDIINGAITSKLSAQSEGVVIDVYENCVLYRGRNFVDEKFIPIGQFLLPKAQGILPSENGYVIAKSLNQSTISNETTVVEEGGSYSAIIAPNDGYVINKVTVKMGGTDVTSDTISVPTVTYEWEQGGLNSTGGFNDGLSNRIRTAGSISITEATTFTANTEYQVWWYRFNPDLTFVDSAGAWASSFTLQPDADHVYWIAIRKSDSSDLTPDESTNVTITTVTNSKTINIESVTGDVSISVKTIAVTDEDNVIWTYTDLDSTTGEASNSSTYLTSEYIAYNSEHTYTLFAAKGIYYSTRVFFYDANQAFISRTAQLRDFIYTHDNYTICDYYLALTIPKNTAYIRIRPGVNTNGLGKLTPSTASNYFRLLTEEDMVELTGLAMSQTELTFTTSDSQMLSVIKTPENATVNVTWKSSSSSIANVNSGGMVTPVANGNCVITATYGDYSTTCNVTVDAWVYCTGVTLDQTELALDADNTTATLTATVTPEGCTDTLGWETSNPSVATVRNGVVTAVGVGNATITATCGSYSAECIVTVTGIDESNTKVLTLTWEAGNITSGGVNNDSDISALRTTNIEYDSNYDYTIYLTTEFKGVSNIKVYNYESNGTYINRKTNSELGITSTGETYTLAFPNNTGIFRIKVDVNTSNSVDNLNDRLILMKVSKATVETVSITYNDGVKIDRSTGAESSSSSYYASDYIPYESGKEYELSINSDSQTTGNYVYICYYDTDKTFISCTDYYVGYASSGYLASSVLTIPEGTGYIRLRGSIGSGDYATSQAQITLTATAQ